MNLRNKVKIARCYYLYGMSQEQIAKRFNISRQKVIRELKCLRDENIVKLEIAEYDDEDLEMEKQLEDRFGFIDSVVIREFESESLNEELGYALGNYLNERLETGSVLGIAGGPILERSVEFINFKYTKLSVVQLMGCLMSRVNQGHETKYICNTDQLLILYAQKLEAMPYFAHTSIFVENGLMKEMLMRESYIKKSFTHINKCNVGIFQIFDEKIIKKYLQAYDNDLFEKTIKYPGSIIFNFYDVQGHFVEIPEINQRYLGPNIEQLKNIPLRIGVCSKNDNPAALLGAVRSNFFHILILDREAAYNLIVNVK
jgi:DNA-binding transcriptional regulator LsrR (DeoR family)